MDILLWTLAALMIVAGVFGTVLPALPGPPLVLLGALLAAWIDNFTHISGLTCAILSALTLFAMAVDWFAGALGAKRAGASKLALVGAFAGALLGVFTGLIGLVFMPLLGAALGEFIARRDLLRAGQVGLATWLGMIAGTVLKLAVVTAMVAILLFNLALR